MTTSKRLCGAPWQKGMRLAAVDQSVALVDGWLEKNRKKAA